MHLLSFNSLGAKMALLIKPWYALIQSSFVFLKGIIASGLRSFDKRLSNKVEEPQKLQNVAAVLSGLMISAPHWLQWNLVTSNSETSCAPSKSSKCVGVSFV